MSENLTPMMRQYQQVKKEAPADALLLFRLGDFFEMFFDDAKTGASLLNLTLTKRNGVPMCGVPAHSAENYIGKLIQMGKRVAVCDQISEPKPGQVVDRAITQIFSPGCVMNLNLTQPKENRFLAAVQEIDDKFGFAYLDLTTGDFRLTEIVDARGVQDEILRLHPKELLFPSEQTLLALPDGISLAKTAYDDWIFEKDFATLTLREHFKVQSLDGFGCSTMPAGIGAAGSLIHYVTQTLRGSAAHVLGLKTYSTLDYLILDSTTQKNLELVESAHAAAANTSLLKAIDQTVTAMGGRELRSWILHPLRDAEKISQRQEMIEAWLDDIGRLENFREQLQEVRDLERLIGRIAQGSGNARDAQALRQSLEQIPSLKKCVDELNKDLAKILSQDLKAQPGTIDLIKRAIVEDPPMALKEGGLIATGYHAELDELHTAMREGKNWLAELQAKEQERTGIKSLKVRFNQVFGYYIEITKANLAQVPLDYTRKQTMVNAERFITPELKEMEGKILGAEERARKLEYEIFLEIRDQIAQKTREIQATARALAQLDVLAGLAQLARLQCYVKPEIGKNDFLEITEGRHPVLEQQLREEKFVPNDTRMDQENCRVMILTGPNMAGKSTYIRQVALIALLFHIGSYVPAQSAKIPIMDRIFTRIGASDDLSRGQSTFMVEMNETANILNNATQNSLVILDEIGRGTSTFDGLSIAWSVAEYLHNEVKAKTLFATHYHELTELSVTLPALKNFNIAVREWQDQIIFLRKIVEGGADKSYGIQVARLAGLPKGVLDRAKEILRNLEESELDATGKPARAVHRNGKKENNGEQMDLFKQG
ncbi:MAG: DNA mismatch repair protein MutS [Verrucomicrobiota bacterium]